jgi:hypothetical protein
MRPQPGHGGNVRAMTVDDWATFITNACGAQQKSPQDVALSTKQMIKDSGSLTAQEKDTIIRTIDRGLRVCLGDIDIGLEDGPDGPVIRAATPKVEGRYEGAGLFLDPSTLRQIGTAIVVSPIRLFTLGALVWALALLGFPNTWWTGLVLFSLGSFYIMNDTEDDLTKRVNPRLRVEQGPSLTRILALTAISAAFTAAITRVKEDHLFISGACLPLTAPIADILWFEAQANFYERRPAAGTVLLGLIGIVLLAPAVITFLM